MRFFSFEEIRATADCAALARELYGVTIRGGRCARCLSAIGHASNARWAGNQTKDERWKQTSTATQAQATTARTAKAQAWRMGQLDTETID
jgi:hypothetical protein